MVDTFNPGDWTVVWDGGELLPERITKPHDTWVRGKRLYKKRQDQAWFEQISSAVDQQIFDEDNFGVGTLEGAKGVH